MVLGSLIDPSLWRQILPDEKDWLPVKYTINAAHIEAPAQAMGFVYPAGTVNVIDRDFAAFFMSAVPRTRDREARKSRVELQQSRETADCRKKNAAAQAKAEGKKKEKVVGPSAKVTKKKTKGRRKW
jgi:hypothetical protein